MQRERERERERERRRRVVGRSVGFLVFSLAVSTYGGDGCPPCCPPHVVTALPEPLPEVSPPTVHVNQCCNVPDWALTVNSVVTHFGFQANPHDEDTKYLRQTKSETDCSVILVPSGTVQDFNWTVTGWITNFNIQKAGTYTITANLVNSLAQSSCSDGNGNLVNYYDNASDGSRMPEASIVVDYVRPIVISFTGDEPASWSQAEEPWALLEADYYDDELACLGLSPCALWAYGKAEVYHRTTWLYLQHYNVICEGVFSHSSSKSITRSISWSVSTALGSWVKPLLGNIVSIPDVTYLNNKSETLTITVTHTFQGKPCMRAIVVLGQKVKEAYADVYCGYAIRVHATGEVVVLSDHPHFCGDWPWILDGEANTRYESADVAWAEYCYVDESDASGWANSIPNLCGAPN